MPRTTCPPHVEALFVTGLFGLLLSMVATPVTVVTGLILETRWRRKEDAPMQPADDVFD